MVMQEGPPSLVRRSTERAQETRDRALGNGDTEHLEFAMNPGRAPQRIGGDHLCNQSAKFCGGAGATSTPALRMGKAGPESSEPLALPARNGVCLDVLQGLAPVAPKTAKDNPKHPIPGCQQWTLPVSLKGCNLHSQRGVLDGHGLMAAEEQSDKSKHQQEKNRHVSDSFLPSRLPSTRYERIEYWRTSASSKGWHVQWESVPPG